MMFTDPQSKVNLCSHGRGTTHSPLEQLIRRPTDLVFDEPFEPACATPGRPTDAEVAAAHAEYIARLRRLFDDHKDSFGFEDRQLLVT